LPDLCSTCEVRIQFDYFKESFEQELSRRTGGERLEWSFASLYADLGRVLRINAELGGEGDPQNSDALTVACLNIWRNEQNRPLRIAQWEADQKRRSTDHR